MQRTDQGLNPRHWGPHFWKTIHFVAFGYPKNPSEEDKLNYKNFYSNIKNILPCQECREHFTELMNNPKTSLSDNDLKSMDTLVKWTYNTHNIVNAKIGVEYQLSYDEFISTYEFCKSDCTKKKSCYVQSDNAVKHTIYEKAPVVSYDICIQFTDYAKSIGFATFDQVLENTQKNINDKNFRVARDKKCWEILNSMKNKNAHTSANKLSKHEILLLSLMSSSLHRDELKTAVKLIRRNL